MNPMLIIGLVSIGVSVLTPIITSLISQGKKNEAASLLDQARQYVSSAQLPQLEKFKEQMLGPSALTQLDPSTRAAEMDSMDALKGIQDSGGLQLSDKVALNDVNNQAARADSTARARVLDSMRSRGMNAPGMELQAQLAAVQGGADRAAETGAQTAANAQQRAYNSILARANLAGNIQGQDSRVAEAKDAIAKYNAQAAERGQEMRNQYAQQLFQDQMTKAGVLTGASKDQAGFLSSQANQEDAVGAGIGRAAGQGLNAYAAGMAGTAAPATTAAPAPSPARSFDSLSNGLPYPDLYATVAAPTGTTYDPYAQDPNYPNTRKGN